MKWNWQMGIEKWPKGSTSWNSLPQAVVYDKIPMDLKERKNEIKAVECFCAKGYWF